jgi:DNA end-binding protein Ku
VKTLWNGSLELGELVVPVGLAATVRDGRETFRRLHASCRTPIAMRPWCDRDQEILDESDIVPAWEVAPGEYLRIEAEERDALKPIESRRVPINCFVPLSDLEVRHLLDPYELVPSKTVVGRRSYQLLAGAIHELEVTALARFVWLRSEKLAAIASSDGKLLQLTTLRFAEDLLERPSLDPVSELGDRLQELARELVRRHTRPLAAGDLDSLWRPRVRELLEGKLLSDEPIVRAAVEKDERAAIPSLDLEATLERSLKTAPPRRRRRRAAAAAAG